MARPPTYTPEDLIGWLEPHGAATAAQIRGALGVSAMTLSRLVRRVAHLLVFIGEGPSRRYARRLPLLGAMAPIPIYRVGDDGRASHTWSLHGLFPRAYWLEAHQPGVISGVFEGLPWFMQGLRPMGFLGRLVPRLHPQLSLPADLRLWSDEQTLRYLATSGWDLPGDLIVGDPALNLYLESTLGPRADRVPEGEAGERYAQMARDVLAYGVPGSSAAGEQPKLLATLERQGHSTPVLVKFSRAWEDPLGQRMSDLLVCEHLAHKVLGEAGVPTCRSRAISHEHRTWLEIERFDRTTQGGRRGVVALEHAVAEVGGDLSNWRGGAADLHREGWIGDTPLRWVRWLHLFGTWIGNTDMHGGNLAFGFDGERIGELAPIYDMLPMAWWPQGEYLPALELHPPLPPMTDGDIALSVWRWAHHYWMRVEAEERISAGVRVAAGIVAQQLLALRPALERLPRPHTARRRGRPRGQPRAQSSSWPEAPSSAGAETAAEPYAPAAP